MSKEVSLHDNSTAPGLGARTVQPERPDQEIAVTLSGTGAISATFQWELGTGANATIEWCVDTGFPQTLSGTNSVSRVFKIAGGANRARLNLTAISGTGATFNAVYSEVG